MVTGLAFDWVHTTSLLQSDICCLIFCWMLNARVSTSSQDFSNKFWAYSHLNKLCNGHQRQKLVINNTAELICDVDGSSLFLASKSRNQFLMFRELFLFSLNGLPDCCFEFSLKFIVEASNFPAGMATQKNSQPTNIEYLAKQCYCDRLGLFFFLDGSPNKIDLVRDAQKLLTSHTSPPWSSSTLPLCPDFPMEAESGGVTENLGCWWLCRCCTNMAHVILKSNCSKNNWLHLVSFIQNDS